MHNFELLNLAAEKIGDTSSEVIETIGAIPQEVPNWFVVVMGIGIVFLGLVCIIVLCKIVALFCKGKSAKDVEKAPVQTAAANTPIENRQEIIAAVAAACAEELGTDVSALRIHSFKKI